MPRTRKTPETPPQSNAVIASAARLNPRAGRGIPKKTSQGWQEDVWGFLDTVGELSFAAQWQANALSRVVLKVVEDLDGETRTVTEGLPVEALAELFGGESGQEQMMSALGFSLFLPGEAYLVGVEHPPPGIDQWRVLSNVEVKLQGSNWEIDRGDGMAERYLAKPNEDDPTSQPEALVFRIWRPHPRLGVEATSPVRAAIPILRELEGLTMHIAASIDSRLAGAGVLLVPSEMTFASPADGTSGDAQQDDFLMALVEAMEAARADRQSPAALAPIVVRVPGALIENVKHLTFTTPLSQEAKTLREEAIRRLSLSLDMPPEVLTGQADSNHWCLDSETEILIQGRGWVNHTNLRVGDVAFTLNHATGLAEWSPVLDVYRADVVDEPVLRMESRSHSSVSTLGHRWPIMKAGQKVAGTRRRWTTSGDGFSQSDRVPLAAALAEQEQTTKYRDDFVRLVVAYSADGTIKESRNVRIVKFQDREILELRRILTTLYGPTGFREHPHRTHTADGVAFVLRQQEAAELLDLCEEGKAIPLSFVDALTHAQREILLASAVEIGDGVPGRNATTVFQVLPERCDAYAYAAHLTGRKVTRGRRNQQTGYGTEPLTWVRWSSAVDSFGPSSCHQTVDTYTGTVWCPTTANRTWFARRNGRAFFTGNSAWLISEDSIKVHIEPLVSLICHALTTQYLWPVLAGDAMGGDVESPAVRRYRIVGDTSKLRMRPSRTSEAMDLHAKLVITDAALARETGFDKGDMLEPGSEEMTRRLLTAVAGGVTTADLTAAALEALGVSLTPKAAEVATTEVVVGEQAITAPAETPAIEGPRELPAQVASAIMEDPIRRHQLAGLLATTDILCHRVLEKANSRLGNRGKHRKPVTDPDAFARATHDAWDLVDRVAALHQVDADQLTAACTMYVRGRLATATDHEPKRLLTYLAPLIAGEEQDGG